MKLFKTARLYGHLIYFQLTSKSTRNYLGQWDSYWTSVQKTGHNGDILWDSEPEQGAAIDLQRFNAYIDPELPLLDLGCGNGRQTGFLGKHCKRVIGVDVSPQAIQIALQETDRMSNVEFRILDITQPAQARKLHDEIGDMNIYMRGVLHVIQEADRPLFMESIKTLLGNKGTLYQIEVKTGALEYLRTLLGDSRSGLPKQMHKVVQHGIRPIGFDAFDTRRPSIYQSGRWKILAKGRDVIRTITLANGVVGKVPANYLITRPA